MTTILLARHGETAWNASRRWQGHADTPLNDVGRAQAQELARRLDGVELVAVYSSDLARARETAEIVAEPRGLPVVPVRALREVHVGEWSGLTALEVETRYPEGFRRWREDGLHGWTTGESYEAMGERVVGALHAIAEAHPRETVLAVTHGGAIRACHAHAAGLSYADSRRTHRRPFGNCELVTLAVDDHRILVVDDDGRRAASG